MESRVRLMITSLEASRVDGWRWTLNNSDGFRGTEVRPRRGVDWAGWGHASSFAPHIGRGTGSARIVREARPGD